MLALCKLALNDVNEARQLSREAIAASPDESFTFYAAGFVHFQQDDYKKARGFIDEAVRLNSRVASYFDISARIFLIEGKLKQALAEAERGLECDPEHVSCLNAKAMTLIRLKRGTEAMDSVDLALQHNPDSSLSHANKGWLLMENNRTQDAMDHFREALRLQPENSWAREGILESLKHRHMLYAGVAACSLTLTKVARSGPLFWIIWLLPPMRAIYLILVLTSWIGNQVFNLALYLDKDSRRVLTQSEILASQTFGMILILFVLAFVARIVGLLAEGGLVVALAALFLVALPLCRTFQLDEGNGRKVMYVCDGIALLCGFRAVWSARLSVDPDHLPKDVTGVLGLLILFALISVFIRPPRQ